jgi:hypothetical protein
VQIYILAFVLGLGGVALLVISACPGALSIVQAFDYLQILAFTVFIQVPSSELVQRL